MAAVSCRACRCTCRLTCLSHHPCLRRHAMMGFWAGIAPEGPSTTKYQPRLVFPKPTHSLLVGASALIGGYCDV